jgi:hypothetical protein
MTVIKKAFLSHSSLDKDIVRPIFHRLTMAHAHYDEHTFEQGNTSAAEILSGIRQSSLFVLFVSSNSVKSPWVQSEIRIAEHEFVSGRMKRVLIFIVDDTSVNDLPDWLRPFVYRKLSNSSAIADVIRAALIEIAAVETPILSLFLGRAKEVTALVGAFASFSEPGIAVIAVSGNEGLGRRTALKRALLDVHPELAKMPAEITLDNSEGAIEFYRALLNKCETYSVDVISTKQEVFGNSSNEGRAILSLDLINKISSAKQIVFLRGGDALISDSGVFPKWLSDIIEKLDASPWPKLAIVSRRTIAPSKRGNYPNVFFQPISSLDDDPSKQLLSLWLKHFSVAGKPQLVNDIAQYVSGHPRNIQVAARLAAEFGEGRLNAQRKEYLDALRNQASALLEGLAINEHREKLLALFAEYEYLSHEDLVAADPLGNDENLPAALGYLVDYGILENDDHYIRLAPYLPIALSRYVWSPATKAYLEQCQENLLERVSLLVTTDLVDISTIDSAILAALRSGKNSDNILLQRCLLPSHLLKVARDFYDKQNYGRAIALAWRAYDSKGKLSIDAQIECLRLTGLSAVRLADEMNFDKTLFQLKSYNEQLANRTANFVRGFKARFEGKPESAHDFFRKAYSLGGERNFHILRELAQLCRIRENYVEGEAYARAALGIAKENPFVIDNLLEILIQRHKADRKYLQSDIELQELLSRLENCSKFENRSFYESRRAHLFGVLGDQVTALEWAERAVAATPWHIPVILRLAEIQISMKNFRFARDNLVRAQRQIAAAASNADKRHTVDLDKVSVHLEMEAGNFSVARQTLSKAFSMPSNMKVNLAKQIDAAEAYQNK